MSGLTLLVLAAGEGKRIKPIITSKPLLPFMGKTLLELAVEQVSGLKPDRLVIVINPRDREQIGSIFPKAELAIQAEATGMAGAVEAARPNLHGPTVVVNGDDWLDKATVNQFAEQIIKGSEKVILTGNKNKAGLSGGYFDLKGSTLKVREKQEKGEWFKLVLDYFPKIEEFVAALEAAKSDKDDVYEQALNSLELTLVKTRGDFFQVKYPWQILDLTEALLKQAKGKALIDKTAKVFPGAHIINSYIGPGVTIGHNCLVRDSIIEAETVVGFNSEIARSYVGPKNFFHSNYVGDSVIEGESNFGAGAVLANFRFDHLPIGSSGRAKLGAIIGKGAQVGVNASLMPGVMLKSGEIAWAGAVRK